MTFRNALVLTYPFTSMEHRELSLHLLHILISNGALTFLELFLSTPLVTSLVSFILAWVGCCGKTNVICTKNSSLSFVWVLSYHFISQSDLFFLNLLCLLIDYLGSTEFTFTLLVFFYRFFFSKRDFNIAWFTRNFSKPASPIIAQMFNFLNLGFEGYKKIAYKGLRNARLLSRALEKTYFTVRIKLFYFSQLWFIKTYETGSERYTSSNRICEIRSLKWYRQSRALWSWSPRCRLQVRLRKTLKWF